MTFIKKQIRAEVAYKTIFTTLERFLIRNQNKFVLNQIDSDSDSRDSQVESTFEAVQSSKFYN